MAGSFSFKRSKLFDQLVICFAQFRSWLLPSEIEEDFESCVTPLIEQLEAQRFMLIQVTRLAESKYRSQLPTADVHIEQVGTNIQETIFDRKPAELTEDLNEGVYSENTVNGCSAMTRACTRAPTGNILV